MDIRFQTESVGKALELMLMGMVGIFIVMGVLLGVVVLLNKVTAEKNESNDDDKK